MVTKCIKTRHNFPVIRLTKLAASGIIDFQEGQTETLTFPNKDDITMRAEKGIVCGYFGVREVFKRFYKP